MGHLAETSALRVLTKCQNCHFPAYRYLLPYSLPFFLLSVPNSKCFVRLIGFIRFALHFEHSNFNTIFLVVLAFLWKIGLVCPPKPACFLSYRRLPCALNDALPVLYCDTLWGVCFLHLRQYVLLVLGMFTMAVVGNLTRASFTTVLST
mmetsp:Transcript_20435/g.46895  ORF Transcript_20435/g.46895 Transcript_20435/m.46895 type:complete len:149 (+) Transcript_20435:122-568(+)